MKPNKYLLWSVMLMLTFLFAGCLFISGGILLRNNNTEPPRQITSQIIVDKINEEAFLITRTVFLQQDTSIKIDQGSDWSNFWWGKKIDAEALIRLDIGVDFSKLTPEDIVVDNKAKTIDIKLPDAEILDANLNGKIEVKANNGILRSLFANDPNQDFNLALEELIQSARDKVTSDTELLSEAKADSVKLLELILADTGYTLTLDQ